MKTLSIILSVIVLTFNSCGSTKDKTKSIDNSGRMEFIITKIENEKDGRTLLLQDDKGAEYTTVISIPNGNYVEVEKGNRISLVAKEILEMHPALIISENIRVIKTRTQTSIATNKSTYRKGEPIELIMVLKNTSAEPYTFLPWGTPLENRFTRPCLEVYYNDQKVPYSGIMVKRMAPTDKDYVTLKQGETYSGKANLLEGYKLTEKGMYTIQFKERYDGLPSSNSIKITLE